MLFVYAAIAALIFFFDPRPAYAWGPGTHLEIALTALKHAAWALPLIRNLIETYPAEFIYGSVSPDIVVGKHYAGAIHHCHNWSIGKLILEEASNDMDRAAAWGYLTHLSADCVAHNYFVPLKIMQSFSNRPLGHTYWEMRYDLHVADESWRQLKNVIRHDYSSFDHLLERVLKKTIFSFRTSKRIFNSILILHKMKQLRFGLRTYAKASRWKISENEIRHFQKLTMETVQEFLKSPEKAHCLKADPAGRRKLRYAAETRQQLRRLLRRGKISEKEADPFLAKAALALEKGLFDNSISLPTV